MVITAKIKVLCLWLSIWKRVLWIWFYKFDECFND